MAAEGHAEQKYAVSCSEVSNHSFLMQYSSEIVFLGVVHFRVVHLGSPWTRGQCFVHHLLNVFSFKVESNFLQVISKIIHRYCALLSNWNNGKRRNRRTGCYSKGSCNILSL